MLNRIKNQFDILKFASTILLFVFITAVLFVGSTCSKQKRFKNITYEGYCYHSKSNPTPEEGVSVTLSACGITFGEVGELCSGDKFEIGKSTTDASGHFIIKGKAARSGFYFVHYIKNNYGNDINGGKGMDESALKNASTIYVYY